MGTESQSRILHTALLTAVIAVAFIGGYGMGVDSQDYSATALDRTGGSVTCDIWASNGSANAICFATNGVNVTINNESEGHTVTGNVSLYGLPENTTEETDAR